MTDENTIEIVCGDKRAVFVRDAVGWKPDWFYHGQRAMLRLKDHQWLSIGHVHPEYAQSGKKVGNSAIFGGRSMYGTTIIEWTVKIKPAPRREGAAGAFVIETTFKPERSIELLEAYTTFELPYEYDGSEEFTTVIGQNPIVQFKGKDRTSPPVWCHPAWVYAKPQTARNTAPTFLPTLCHAIANSDGSNARYTTIVGDWKVCKTHDIMAAPTRSINPPTKVTGDDAPPAQYGQEASGEHGVKFFMGALNWSSAYNKDPNVLFAAGRNHRQRVIVDVDSSMPGGSIDAMVFSAWQRAASMDMPASGRLDAFDRASARGVSWTAATKWLRNAFVGGNTPGFFSRERGINVYAPGTRPKFDSGEWGWWTQWSGPLHYRAMLLGDSELEKTCSEYDKLYRDHTKGTDVQVYPYSVITCAPSLRFLKAAGVENPLAEAIKDQVQTMMTWLKGQDGANRKAGIGGLMFVAECLLLASKVYAMPDAHEAATGLLRQANAQLDGHFWDFDMFGTSMNWHGNQARPLCYAHALAANRLAFEYSGDDNYLDAANRFARLLVGLHYMTHNGSEDADFDFRGWANGTNAGRDQIAECPPWETSNSLICMAGLMGQSDMPAGCYDAIWYFARTGLAQFPAARGLKRILDESMRVRFVPRAQLASEKDFYDALPYMAYENPRDQTLLAAYQGSDCLIGELVYGGALVACADDRVTAVVAKAADLDPSVATARVAHLWNPTARQITTSVTAKWHDGSTSAQEVSVPSRRALRVELRKQTT